MLNRSHLCIGLLLTITAATTAMAQYEIPWHTVDGGGAMFSTGGTFSLGGTIGQHDASSFAAPMAGGTFELIGGFWAPAPSTCPCLGDMNADQQVDLLDFAEFQLGFGMSSGASCADGDLDGDGDVDLADLALLLPELGTGCP